MLGALERRRQGLIRSLDTKLLRGQMNPSRAWLRLPSSMPRGR